MVTHEYLYGGDNIDEVPDIPQDIIMRRVEMLKEHMAELLAVDYKNRDFKRVDDISSAIDFWNKINSKEL